MVSNFYKIVMTFLIVFNHQYANNEYFVGFSLHEYMENIKDILPFLYEQLMSSYLFLSIVKIITHKY